MSSNTVDIHPARLVQVVEGSALQHAGRTSCKIPNNINVKFDRIVEGGEMQDRPSKLSLG